MLKAEAPQHNLLERIPLGKPTSCSLPFFFFSSFFAKSGLHSSSLRGPFANSGQHSSNFITREAIDARTQDRFSDFIELIESLTRFFIPKQ